MSDHLVNWSIELNEFDIDYHARKTIKGKALTNFVTELTHTHEDILVQPTKNPWQIYIDGSSCQLSRG